LLIVPVELQKPKNEADFERMCAEIYGVVFNDPRPKVNGRKGQAQGGVDVFVEAQGFGRIGVQCKKYLRTALEWKHVVEEVQKADKFGTPIRQMLIATTAPSDAALLKKVQVLSDDRQRAGKFGVEIEFWEDIENRIASHTILQDSYSPQAVGAAFHRQASELAVIKGITVEVRDTLSVIAALPAGREDSADRIITGQLDRTNELLRAGKYRDALEHVDSVGSDLAPFDAHQKARWYLQRGLCLWFSRDDVEEAASLFLKAAECYPDDERMAAAGIRGRLLRKDLEGALAAGMEAAERFPASVQVWLAHANARMLAGQRIVLGEAPATLRDEPDVVHFAAISAKEKGDLAEAIALSERAAAAPGAGFVTRATFLAFAVEHCAHDPVLAQFGVVPVDRRGRLSRAAEYFEPRRERLWNVQSDATTETAAHLGFAFLLLRVPEKALEVAREARAVGVYSKDLLRVEIQALDETGRRDEALAAAKASLTDLPPEALAAACEIATERGDVRFVESAAGEAGRRFPENIEAADLIAGLRWGALVRSGNAEKAVAEILGAMPSRLVPLCAAARLLRWAQRPIEAAEAADRATVLVGPDTKAPDRLLVADLMFLFERWRDAAKLFEGLLTAAGPGPSELHARLLECHVELENRAKAQRLLKDLPDGWVEHDETRRVAFKLGQKAGDWKFLLPLARRQVEKEPGEAVSWLFLLHVMSHVEDPAAFQAEVRRVPEEVSGTIRNVSALAGLELRYDEGARGMRRLYRLARRNMDDPEALAAYLINLLIARVPPIGAAPAIVAAGCAVDVVEADGERQETMVLDPTDAGPLPKRDGFVSPEEPEAVAMMGAAPGDVVEIPMRAGGTRTVKVVAVGSAYLRVAALAQERSHREGGLPHMKSVPVGDTGDPEKDLARMYEEIRRSRVASQQVLEAYESGGMTLHMLCKALGRSPVEICLGWPREAPPLFVGSGIAQEREAALALLRRPDGVFVADSMALAELARLRVGHALEALPRVLVSPVTKEAVDALIAEIEDDRTVGTAFDNDGRLGFVEFDDKRRAERIALSRTLAETLSRCEIATAYADLGESEEARDLANVMGLEEKEMVLLAKARGAVAITLDGRMRMLAAHVYGVEGVWPQVVVMRALEYGVVKSTEASSFAIGEFLSNRSFVSLRSDDLVWMVSQGDAWLQAGISALKRYLASPETDMTSSFDVCLGFLQRVAYFLDTQLGAFGEILFHVAEAMFRRADCPIAWERRLAGFAEEILSETAQQDHVLPEAYRGTDRALALRLNFVRRRIVEAKTRAAEPPSDDPVRIRVLHGAVRPWLVVDQTSRSDGGRGEMNSMRDEAAGISGTEGRQTSAAATRI
jgi:transcription elongation GreA/GreB family factor